ncbi:MAG: hypothetical protein K6E18_06860 [Lachnospiraceae bacterium]|nr:hypothetical protein [Lachnospiraceae bacterium]
MKEQENVLSYNQNLYGMTLGTYMDENFSTDKYERAEEKEKREILQGYFKAKITQDIINVEENSLSRTKDAELEKLNKQYDTLNALFATDHYKQFEDSVVLSGMTGKDLTKKEVVDFIHNGIGNATLKPGYEKIAYGKNNCQLLTQKTNEYCINNHIKTAEENIAAAQEKAKEPMKKASTVLETYTNSMSLFNKKRASFFKQESTEHKELREAAEKMQSMRSTTFEGKQFGIKEALAAEKNAEARMNIAKTWLRNAHELRDAAKNYINIKDLDFVTLSPSGRDRKRGAKQLKKLGKAEIDQCRNTINSLEGNGVDLKSVYEELKNDKVSEAYTTINSLSKVDTLNHQQELKLWDAVHTVLGAQTVDKSLDRGMDIKDCNIFRATEKNKHSLVLNTSVTNYIQNTKVSDIIKDINSGPNVFIKKIKAHKPDLAKDFDVTVAPKQPKQNKAPKQKPMGF